MLSEDLQHGVGGDEASEAGVPHGTQVFACEFIELGGESPLIEPLRFAIRCQTRCERTCVFWTTGLYGK